MPFNAGSGARSEGPPEDETDLSVLWRRATGVLWRRSLDGVILARLDDDCGPTSLTTTGRAIWDLLEEPLSIAQLTDALGAAYAGEPEIITRDATELLQKLEARCLVARDTSDKGAPR